MNIAHQVDRCRLGDVERRVVPSAADVAKRSVRASSSMASRPLWPLIGIACSRTNFMPLYSAGLWLARHHDAAVQTQMEGGKISICSVPHRPMSSTSTPPSLSPGPMPPPGLARGANVPADGHFLRMDHLGVRPPDAVSQIFVELIGDDSRHVIRFKRRQPYRCCGILDPPAFPLDFLCVRSVRRSF